MNIKYPRPSGISGPGISKIQPGNTMEEVPMLKRYMTSGRGTGGLNPPVFRPGAKGISGEQGGNPGPGPVTPEMTETESEKLLNFQSGTRLGGTYKVGFNFPEHAQPGYSNGKPPSRSAIDPTEDYKIHGKGLAPSTAINIPRDMWDSEAQAKDSHFVHIPTACNK